MLVSGLILVLYIWPFVPAAPQLAASLLIDSWAAIAAGIAFIAAGVSYLWAPSKWLFRATLGNYGLLLVAVCLLIFGSGSLDSPFIALWMVLALFSAVFGWYGVGLVLTALIGFLAWSMLGETLDVGDALTATLLTIGPIAVGALGLRPTKSSNDDYTSYSGLASELTNASGKSEAVIAAIADGVLALDAKGTIQLINPAAQKLIGWNKSDAVGLDYKSVLKIIDPRDKEIDPANDPVRQAIETNKSTHVDTYSLQQADTAKKFLASLTVSPVGSLGSGVIVVFRDITTEKAEEREQAEFISTASHEMRTPVASIEGYLGLALNPQTAQIDDRAREYIGKAQDSAKHLGRLFQDLLDVSRADDGRLSNDPRVVDVIPFIGDIAQGLMPSANDKGLQVIYKPDPEFIRSGGQEESRTNRVLSQVLYVNVDNDHLREVMANLIENAIKYTVAGTITVNAEGDDEHVTMSVADSGIGIPQADIPHLFQKFYRVDNTQTREIGGTGLGLYLCRKLVEAMGGQIWAESQYEQGSTFYVRLPRVDHVEAGRLIEQASLAKEQPSMIHAVTTGTVTPNQPAAPVPTQAPLPATPSQPAAPPPVIAAPVTQPTNTPPAAPIAPQAAVTAEPAMPATEPTTNNAAAPPATSTPTQSTASATTDVQPSAEATPPSVAATPDPQVAPVNLAPELRRRSVTADRQSARPTAPTSGNRAPVYSPEAATSPAPTTDSQPTPADQPNDTATRPSPNIRQ